jgi:hypothetical protein
MSKDYASLPRWTVSFMSAFVNQVRLMAFFDNQEEAGQFFEAKKGNHQVPKLTTFQAPHLERWLASGQQMNLPKWTTLYRPVAANTGEYVYRFFATQTESLDLYDSLILKGKHPTSRPYHASDERHWEVTLANANASVDDHRTPPPEFEGVKLPDHLVSVKAFQDQINAAIDKGLLAVVDGHLTSGPNALPIVDYIGILKQPLSEEEQVSVKEMWTQLRGGDK